MAILKNIKICFLALCILVNTWMVPLIYLDFEIRKEYIANVLCINQAKTMTVCGGKCYLNDRLRNVADQQGNEAETSTRSFSFSFFSQEIIAFQLVPPKIFQEKGSRPLTPQCYTRHFYQGVFRPPRLS